MDFDWSPKQAAYRTEIRKFIERELPHDYAEMTREGWASVRRAELSREFCRKLAGARMLVRHWPEEYGGGGDGDWWNYLIQSEENLSFAEPRGPQYMNTSWIGPAIMKYGTEEQQKKFLPPIREGAVIWCQGFSEPSAGSDLAAMRTHAERRGDGYVINGSKIWTSYAPYADYIFLLARTSQEKRQVSAFLLPMNAKGITVHSHPGIVPFGHLNEVFFEDVFAPIDARLGEEGRAWEIVKHVLDHERVGVPVYHQGRMVLDLVVRRLQEDGRFESPFVQAEAGRVLAAFEAARQLSYAVMNERAKGQAPSAAHTLARAANIHAARLFGDFLSKHVGAEFPDHDGRVEDFYRLSFANAHGGGAYEIVLNTVALQHLRLPREEARA